MALSLKYGKIDIPRIEDGDPVFILRAQDKLAEPTIQMYRLLVASHDYQIADKLVKEISAFKLWPGNKKMPD
jgi:hypothetical protein